MSSLPAAESLPKPGSYPRLSTSSPQAAGLRRFTPTPAPVRAHNPADIRTHAILEVVELVPSRVPSQAPQVKTLTYPISVEIVHAVAVGDSQATQAPDTDANGGAANQDGARGNGDGRPRNRRRGRKRRRAADTPDGRADGMALDGLGTMDLGPHVRADGLAMSACPPHRRPSRGGALPPVLDRTIDPWPRQRRARRSCRHAKKGKRWGWKKKDADTGPLPKPAAEIAASPTGSAPQSPGPALGTDGQASLAESEIPCTPDATGRSNPLSACVHGQEEPDALSQSVPRDQCGDQPTPSFVLETQPLDPPLPAADPLSGLGIVTSSPSTEVLEPSVDRAVADKVGGNATAAPSAMTSPDATNNQASPRPNTCESPPTILRRPTPVDAYDGPSNEAQASAQPTAASLAAACTPTPRPAARFASPPITMRRRRPCPPQPWTLGDFLTAATKHLTAALPTPRRRRQRPALNFAPRRGRSACAATAVPPTTERRAHMHVLRSLGIIGANQRITAEEMKTYEGMFAAPIPLTGLTAMAALVDREMPPIATSLDAAATPGGPVLV